MTQDGYIEWGNIDEDTAGQLMTLAEQILHPALLMTALTSNIELDAGYGMELTALNKNGFYCIIGKVRAVSGQFLNIGHVTTIAV